MEFEIEFYEKDGKETVNEIQLAKDRRKEYLNRLD